MTRPVAESGAVIYRQDISVRYICQDGVRLTEAGLPRPAAVRYRQPSPSLGPPWLSASASPALAPWGMHPGADDVLVVGGGEDWVVGGGAAAVVAGGGAEVVVGAAAEVVVGAAAEAAVPEARRLRAGWRARRR